MKKIPLTRGKHALVDDKDFAELSKFSWCVNGSGYAVRGIWKDKKVLTVLMHRIILNTPNYVFTDHINRNKLDNRRSNLRTCNNKQNLMNQKVSKNNISGFKGVSFYKKYGNWRAQINRKTLGYFKTAKQAALAYNKAARSHFGEFANLNKIS